MRKIYVEMVADLFHYGHAEFLRKAKDLGDYLVVGVLSDAWAKQYKQEPVLTQEERCRVIEACRYVDEVLLQPEPATAEWIKEQGFAHTAIALRNDADHERHMATSVGYDRERERMLPYEQGISTSDILERIETRKKAKALETRAIQEAFAVRWDGGEWLLAEQMLKDISALFAKHKIPFFLTFGSLLGAARHQGVIPWDDDIDIAIFEQDEERFKHLHGELQLLGYGIIDLDKASDRGKDTFYRVYIQSVPSKFQLNYSWPFIDVFVTRPSSNPKECQIDLHPFPKAYFEPLQEMRFGGVMLPAPHADILKLMYDDDYMSHCFSANFIHRHEKPIAQMEKSAKAVKEAGCFVDMHALAQSVWKSVPQRMEGWKLVTGQGSVHLVRNRMSLHISESVAAIWDLMDQRSIGELLDKLTGPRITVLYKLLEIISLLKKHRAITLI